MTRSLNRWLGALALAGMSATGLAQAPASSTATPSTAPSSVARGAHLHACGGRYGMHEQPHPLLHVLHRLNLTAAQKSQIDSVCEAMRPQMRSLAESTHENLEALFGTPPSDARYAALLETAKTNALAHVKLLSDTQAKIYAVLTPEQQAKIPEILAAEKAKREAWRARHAPAPPAAQ